MLKFTASSSSKKKDKKDKRSSKLFQGSSQISPSSSIDGQDDSATSQDEENFSDSTNETGTVKRRRSYKNDKKKPDQGFSNGSNTVKEKAPVPCKAFVGGGKIKFSLSNFFR